MKMQQFEGYNKKEKEKHFTFFFFLMEIQPIMSISDDCVFYHHTKTPIDF